MCSARLVCLLEAIDYLLEIIDNVRKVGANEQSGDDCARVNDIDLLLREFTTLEFMPLVADIGHVLRGSFALLAQGLSIHHIPLSRSGMLMSRRRMICGQRPAELGCAQPNVMQLEL